MVPAGWGFGMRVALQPSGTGIAGYMSPVHSGTNFFGEMNPTTFANNLIRAVYIAPPASSNTAIAMFGNPSAQIAGMGRVTLTAQGFGGSVSIPWSAGNSRYQVINQTAFGDFMRANVGVTIGVTLVGSPSLFEAPYPWEPFTTHALLNDWVEELDLEVPENWFSLTIAAKKAFLQVTYGE